MDARERSRKYAPTLPCMTTEDVDALIDECVPLGDHSCGCDGAIDDGCPWCTPEKLIDWQKRRIRERNGWGKPPSDWFAKASPRQV